MIKILMKLLSIEKIEDIKIQEHFKMPKAEKLRQKYIFYITHRKFEQPIVLNKDNYLLDGYTTYLIAKRIKRKYVKVKRVH